jgi:hypothetical protein
MTFDTDLTVVFSFLGGFLHFASLFSDPEQAARFTVGIAFTARLRLMCLAVAAWLGAVTTGPSRTSRS